MKATATILARVEDKRFHKAVEGMRNGAYHVLVTLHTKEEARGFVRSGNGKEYGCTITDAGGFCSCPDALYRGGICKHSVALALHVVRTPKDKVQKKQKERPVYNLKLARTSPDFASCP